ncbi:MAG: hypothetical protein V7608_2525 [Hyphomicrobiales bacterium]|jgi:hypothetical protein
MHLLLLALGVLVTAVGAVMLAFSVPLTDLAGVALFTSGMIAAVGGFILIGVSAVVRGLNQIAERLDIQPLPMPHVAAVAHEAPAPRLVRAAAEPPVAASVTVSEAKASEPRASEVKAFEAKASEARASEVKASEAKASEVLRAPEAPKPSEPKPSESKPSEMPKAPEPIAARGALLGWFGRAKSPATANAAAEETPRVRLSAVQNGAQTEPSDGPANLAALARSPEPLQASEPFPSIVTRANPAAQFAAEPAPAVAAPAVRPAPRPVPRPAPPAAQKPGAVQDGTASTTVYRSGVIDGMAYSLFMDGSIEAELPDGRVKFGTIDELQKYLMSRR